MSARSISISPGRVLIFGEGVPLTNVNVRLIKQSHDIDKMNTLDIFFLKTYKHILGTVAT